MLDDDASNICCDIIMRTGCKNDRDEYEEAAMLTREEQDMRHAAAHVAYARHYAAN